MHPPPTTYWMWHTYAPVTHMSHAMPSCDMLQYSNSRALPFTHSNSSALMNKNIPSNMWRLWVWPNKRYWTAAGLEVWFQFLLLHFNPDETCIYHEKKDFWMLSVLLFVCFLQTGSVLCYDFQVVSCISAIQYWEYFSCIRVHFHSFHDIGCMLNGHSQ